MRENFGDCHLPIIVIAQCVAKWAWHVARRTDGRSGPKMLGWRLCTGKDSLLGGRTTLRVSKSRWLQSAQNRDVWIRGENP